MSRNWSVICRICLTATTENNLISLFNINNEFRYSTSVELIMTCSSVKIEPNDGFPQNICCQCHSKILDFHNFIVQCERSDKFFRELNETINNENISKINNKIEFDNYVPKTEKEIFVQKLITNNDIDYMDKNDEKESNSISQPKLLKLKHKLDINQVTCFVCNAQVASKNVKKHFLEKQHHKTDNANLCPYCGKSINGIGNMKSHLRIHTGEKPYKCETCHKKFSQWGNLHLHRFVHNGERNHVCKICGKAFALVVTLKKHIKTHSNERKYSCKVCNRQYKHISTLKEHLIIHSGNKNYKCDLCDKMFSFKRTLQVHKRIHIDKKPYLCELCSQSFTQSYRLKLHFKKMHEKKV